MLSEGVVNFSFRVVLAYVAIDCGSFSPKVPHRQHTTLGKEITFSKDKLSDL